MVLQILVSISNCRLLEQVGSYFDFPVLDLIISNNSSVPKIKKAMLDLYSVINHTRGVFNLLLIMKHCDHSSVLTYILHPTCRKLHPLKHCISQMCFTKLMSFRLFLVNLPDLCVVLLTLINFTSSSHKLHWIKFKLGDSTLLKSRLYNNMSIYFSSLSKAVTSWTYK